MQKNITEQFVKIEGALSPIQICMLKARAFDDAPSVVDMLLDLKNGVPSSVTRSIARLYEKEGREAATAYLQDLTRMSRSEFMSHAAQLESAERT